MVLDKRDGVFVFILIVLDQLTKWIALVTKPHNILFDLTWNTGAGFGTLQGHNGWLLLVGIVVLAIIWKPLTESHGHEHTAYLALAAGIIGNGIDRITHHAVVDFISIASFPVFNVADSLITLSVVYLVAKALSESFSSWRFHRIAKRKKK